MQLALASTALVMGLTGGAHCLAMCAAPCGMLTGMRTTTRHLAQPVSQPPPLQIMHWLPQRHTWIRLLGFHLGRLLGYALVGAVVALAMKQLAWLTQYTPALRPVWSMLHVLMLAWGFLMLLAARQPAWLETAGRLVWAKAQPLVAQPAGLFVAGMAWALLPCGLLYTALLMAALSGSAMNGALCMLLFGAGSGLWLLAGPWLWGQMRQRFNALGNGHWGTRLAGLILLIMGGWALWMDVVHGQPAPWCVT